MADTDTDAEHTCRITRDLRTGNACCVPLPPNKEHARWFRNAASWKRAAPCFKYEARRRSPATSHLKSTAPERHFFGPMCRWQNYPLQDEDHPRTPTRFCGHSYCEPVLSSAACSPRSPRRPWRSTPQTSSSIRRIVRAGQRRDVEKPRNRIAFARGLVHVSHTQHDYLEMLRAGELDRDQKRKMLLDACAEEHFAKRFEWLNIQV